MITGLVSWVINHFYLPKPGPILKPAQLIVYSSFGVIFKDKYMPTSIYRDKLRQNKISRSEFILFTCLWRRPRSLPSRPLSWWPGGRWQPGPWSTAGGRCCGGRCPRPGWTGRRSKPSPRGPTQTPKTGPPPDAYPVDQGQVNKLSSIQLAFHNHQGKVCFLQTRNLSLLFLTVF